MSKGAIPGGKPPGAGEFKRDKKVPMELPKTGDDDWLEDRRERYPKMKARLPKTSGEKAEQKQSEKKVDTHHRARVLKEEKESSSAAAETKQEAPPRRSLLRKATLGVFGMKKAQQEVKEQKPEGGRSLFRRATLGVFGMKKAQAEAKNERPSASPAFTASASPKAETKGPGKAEQEKLPWDHTNIGDIFAEIEKRVGAEISGTGKSEGVYRVSGEKTKIDEILHDETRNMIYSTGMESVSIADLASAAKGVIRGNPPIIPKPLNDAAKALGKKLSSGKASIPELETFLEEIKQNNPNGYETFKELINHSIFLLQRSEKTLMGPSNLAKVFGPNLLNTILEPGDAPRTPTEIMELATLIPGNDILGYIFQEIATALTQDSETGEDNLGQFMQVITNPGESKETSESSGME